MRIRHSTSARRMISVLFASILAFSILDPAASRAQDAGGGRIAFDLTSGNAKQLLAVLEVIDETRRTLIKQGVKPEFVLAFRGPATRLVQTDASLFKPEEKELAQKIADKIKALSGSPGIQSVEQCAIAVRLSGLKHERVLADVKVVENSWLTLAAYQAKGYAYIAP